MHDPVIVHAAINASVDADRWEEAMPLDADALSADALAAWDAGAAAIGIHACRCGGSPTERADCLSRVARAVRAEGCDAILTLLCFACGGHRGSAPPVASGLRGLGFSPDAGVIDCAAVERSQPATDGPDYRLREMAMAFRATGIAPQFKCSEPRHVVTSAWLRDGGAVEGRLQLQLVLDEHADEQAMIDSAIAMRAAMPADAVWSLRVGGLGQLRGNVLSLVAGGHVVTGLEDSAWLVEGVPATNRELVERIVRIVDELDRPLATPEEAREILGGSLCDEERHFAVPAPSADKLAIDLASLTG